MPGLSFLSKKSWHTSNLNNQEKVWLAEQQAANEDRKLAELREQIKVEREREEFEKLTNKNVVSDRGTNWMYEGGYAAAGGGEDGEDTTRIKEEEATRKNEAYLLGKEFVPEGKSGHTGDFVEAATMTGALEKASTHGAFSTDNSNNYNGGGGDRMKQLRIDHQEETTSSEAVVAANQEVQKEKDWSKEFHLRHEDPMFAVHQRRQAQLREVEKKKRLMERVGVTVVTKKQGHEGNNSDDGQREKNVTSQPDDDGDNRRRDKKRRSTDEKKKRSKRSSRKEEHYQHQHHYKSKRDHRTRDRYLSSYSSSSYSSSSISMSSDQRCHRDREKDDRRNRRSDKVDDRNGSDRRKERSRSRSRSSDNRQTIRRGDKKRDYDHYHNNDRRKDFNDQKGDGQRRTQHGHYDSRKNDNNNDEWGRRDNRKPTSHHSNNDNNNTREKPVEELRGRYGLVGTSLSNKSNNGNMTQQKVEHQERSRSTYLGPDRNLIEWKRRMENEERERLRQLSHRGHRP